MYDIKELEKKGIPGTQGHSKNGTRIVIRPYPREPRLYHYLVALYFAVMNHGPKTFFMVEKEEGLFFCLTGTFFLHVILCWHGADMLPGVKYEKSPFFR